MMTSKIKCLIVEDEPLAAELLVEYIQDVPFLVLHGITHNAVQASMILEEQDIQLIFLDLHLPGIKGFDFLKSIARPPKVIVTSAYPQYALEGYDLNVLDYLIKPIAFPRFLRAVNKIQQAKASKENTHVLYLKGSRKFIPINEEDIFYIEAKGDYVKVFLKDKIITSKRTLKETISKLSKDKFLRIHRSFVIAIDKLAAFNKNKISILDTELPIGRSYKEKVYAILKPSDP